MKMLAFVVVGFVLLAATLVPARDEDVGQEPPSGNSTIRGRAGRSEIVITTANRVAGAIHSITWNGKEFIDSFDHGRQLQSAANFDDGPPFTLETFNPTEAGSASDGQGKSSSSRLLHIITTPNEIQTTTQMAFWLRPGEKSGDNLAKNTTVLSNHLLTKRVRIGLRVGEEDFPHVIEYDVTFSVPVGEHHKFAQFEVATGYMPQEFGKFWKYNTQSATLEPLSDGPGEQSSPVVFSTEDAGYAMGVYWPPQPTRCGPVGYGRFRFKDEKVNKWNCVFRIQDNARGIMPVEYTFRTLVIVGDLKTVKDTMQKVSTSLQKGD